MRQLSRWRHLLLQPKYLSLNSRIQKAEEGVPIYNTNPALLIRGGEWTVVQKLKGELTQSTQELTEQRQQRWQKEQEQYCLNTEGEDRLHKVVLETTYMCLDSHTHKIKRGKRRGGEGGEEGRRERGRGGEQRQQIAQDSLTFNLQYSSSLQS